MAPLTRGYAYRPSREMPRKKASLTWDRRLFIDAEVDVFIGSGTGDGTGTRTRRCLGGTAYDWR